MSQFRFAQLSDPHLSDLSRVRWHQLMSKRLLGYLSWQRRRRHEHRPELLQELRADLLAQAPEHIVITGDLTHISLPHEFQQALQWLTELGSPEQVSVIPGNHDCYVAADWNQTLGLWRDYMACQLRGVPAQRESAFPTLRVHNSVAFIGVSSAVPAPPFMATGRLGTAQLARLEELLASLNQRPLLKVLLIHHPPVPGEEKWRKRLTDAPQLCALLKRQRVDMILHGHRHRGVHTQMHIPGSSIPVFGIASASAAGIHSDYPCEYHLYDVDETSSGWSVTVTARRLDTASGAFCSHQVARLNLSRGR